MDLSPPAGVSAPRWLLQLTGGDIRLLQDALALMAVANYPAHGAGAPQVFEGLAACFEAVHRREGSAIAGQWARAARRLAGAIHKLTADQSHVNRPTKRERDRATWGVLLRLADMSRSAKELDEGTACIAGHILLAQLRRTRAGDEEAPSIKPLATKTAARLAACAQACIAKSTSSTASDWRALTSLKTFTSTTVLPVAAKTHIGEVRALAQTLVRALEQQAVTEAPRSEQVLLITKGKAVPEPPKTVERRTNKPRKAHPSAAGLMKTASYACMAEAFAVQRYWHWLAPNELRSVTRKLAAVLLSDSAEGDTADFALLALVSLLISHDHACTLKLSLKRNDDLWFCPVLGCAFVDRGLLLDLDGPRGSHGHVLVVFPRMASQAIRKRMAQRPDTTELAGLMQRTPDAAWLSAAEQFVCSLGDPAHPPRSARLSHSLGAAYVATGSTRPIAAQQTLNWALCGDSAPNYYGISAQVANAAAARAFRYLELGEPEELPDGLWSGRADVPNDDTIRDSWQACGEPVQQALEQIPSCQTVNGCLEVFNPAMVACWRALPLVDGGRPTRPDRPTLADTLVHARWYWRDDKDLQERSSARPLFRSEAAADVFSAAVDLRQLLIQRLRELGMRDAELPRTLIDGKHSASLFVEVAWKAGTNERLIARAFSDKLLERNKAPWTGVPNLGRVFWLSESVVADEDWAEVLLSGHGRSLAHAGSVALSRPVMRLLEDCVPFVERTLQRLALPRFAGGLHRPAALQSPQLDLRFIDRRAEPRSRPRDIPSHHVDGDTLPALVIVDACLAQLGRTPSMSNAARALMSLICASGLINADDVFGAWEALSSADAAPDAAWVEWRRPSGQILRMPKQPQTWVATTLCGQLPSLAVAESELRDWLTQQFPAVQWPTRERATIVGLCYLAARWARLHVPPFLVEAYRPELAAATFDGPSNARLCHGDPRRAIGLMDMPRPRQSLRQANAASDSDLKQIKAVLNKHVPRNRKLGGPERRAKRIDALLQGRFDPDQLSPMAAMVLTWLRQEAARWNPRAPRRDVPGTWNEYLRRMLPVLLAAEREGRDPTTFTLSDWQQLGREILNTDDVEDPAKHAQVEDERRHAVARMAMLLASQPDYPDAMAMLDNGSTAGKSPSYRPSRASVLVTDFDVETCAWLLQAKQLDWPLEGLLDEAQLRLAHDGCARADETNALAMSDISADGTLMAFWPHGFTHLKREWNHRTIALRPVTTAVVLAVKEALRRHPEHPSFVFGQQGARIDLLIGRAMQTRVSGMLREITGNPRFVWHALRGAGLMHRLAPGWEVEVLRYLQGPLLLHHAQSVMDKLAGTSVSHLAEALGCSGHLSPGVPISHYLTAWPYWYAMAMRTAVSGKVRVSPELADQVPGASRALLSTANCRYRQDGVVDDWAWLVKQLHLEGWRKDRDPLKHQVLPGIPAVRDDTPLPALNRSRYLLLRTLATDTKTAAHMARIAHGRALRLEPAGALLRRFDEVHKPADGSPPSDVMRRSTIKTLDTPAGRALFTALVFLPEAARTVLRQWLDDSGPTPNLARAKEVLRYLPADVGLDFGSTLVGPRIDLDGRLRRPAAKADAESDGAGVQPSARLFHLPTADAARPGLPTRPNDHRAAVLSALARLTLQIPPTLNHTRSKP